MNPIKTGDVNFVGDFHRDFPLSIPVNFNAHLDVVESIGAGKADIGI